MNVYYGNDLEILSKQLDDIVSVNKNNILQPEIIVTQSKGMNKWLDLYFAKKNGICANRKYIQLNNFIHDIIKIILPDDSLYEGFLEDNFSWIIYSHLSKYKNKYSKLKKYLEDNNELRLWQFSKLMSNTYDQYIIFRPQKILDWEAGKIFSEEKWQADLWNDISTTIKKNLNNSTAKIYHKIQIKNLLEKQINFINNNPKDKDVMDVLSEIQKNYSRVLFFGISYLPDFLREQIEMISHVVETHFLLLQPSVYEKESIIEMPLLSYNGMKGLDFIDKLTFNKNNSIRTFFSYKKFKSKSLLSQLKKDILTNTVTNHFEKLFDNDNSIIIQSCHGKRREVEVLKDYIFKILHEEENITMSDIVIMAPDIDEYAPYIDSVFKEKTHENQLYYSIADRSKKYENESYNIFHLLFEIIEGRFEISKILELFSYEPIYKKYNLDISDIEDIKVHIKQVGIRWGENFLHKKKLDLPQIQENTWEWGFDRILSGYAIPILENDILTNQNIDDIVPYDNFSGSDYEKVGAFIDFYINLKNIKEQLTNQKFSLMEWSEYFKDLLNSFMSFSEETLSDLYELFSSLAQIEEKEYFIQKIHFSLIKQYIEDAFQNTYTHDNFLRGGIVVAGFLPMRSLPFKVVCILGMNESSYPRKDHLPEFNITKHSLGPADRSLRDADRYLFLETIVSAQEKLYISYIGQNIKDNTWLEPSILVQELIDYLIENYKINKEQLITWQKLQPFSISYFDKLQNQYYTYSLQNYNIAKQMLVEAKEENIFCEDVKKIQLQNSKKEVNVSLSELFNFFSNPAKVFLEKKINLYKRYEDTDINDNENFELDSLQQYLLKTDIFHYLKKNYSTYQNKLNTLKYKMKQYYSQQGILPYKNTGSIIFEENFEQSKVILDAIIQDIPEFLTESFNVSSFCSKVFVRKGDIVFTPSKESFIKYILKPAEDICRNLYNQKLVLYRISTVKTKDILQGWIYHLIINYLFDNQIETVLYGIHPDNNTKVDKIIFGKIEDCLKDNIDPTKKNRNEFVIQELQKLLKYYHQGMQEPLPFILNLSFNYYKNKNKDNFFSNINDQYKKTSDSSAKYNFDYNDYENYYVKCFSDDLEKVKNKFIEVTTDLIQPIERCVDKLV